MKEAIETIETLYEGELESYLGHKEISTTRIYAKTLNGK